MAMDVVVVVLLLVEASMAGTVSHVPALDQVWKKSV